MEILIRDLTQIFNSTAGRLFADEVGIEYPTDFCLDLVRVFTPSFKAAKLLFKDKKKQLADACRDWNQQVVEIFSPERSHPIPIAATPLVRSCLDKCQSGDFTMNEPSQRSPYSLDKIWMGGYVEMSRPLYNALGEMIDSDQPQGLVTTDNIQVWLNPAAVRLFKLTSMEDAVPRDTSRDWLPVDLERKRQMVRDAGESAFEIDYATCVGDGSWKKLVNRYRLVDNKYLVGMNVSSEIIERPQITA
jgi:PAS domain-containing protein